MPIRDSWARIKKAWSVFRGNDRPSEMSEAMDYSSVGTSSAYPHTYAPSFFGKDRSLVATIQNRIAIDAAQVKMVQCEVDEDERFVETVSSGLNNVLAWNANIDQSGFEFKMHVFNSLLNDGVIAIVPYRVEPDLNSDEFDIREMRVGTITQWYPKKVKIRLYNDDTGRNEEVILPKSKVAIVRNPFYTVMNERNSLVQMLSTKYKILDMIDQRLGSSKLDLIIQLPYPFKGPTREEQARKRREDLDRQLTDSRYGIGYIDGSEKIIQLNRPIENNLLDQIEYMEKSLYTQLSITPEILNGTANSDVMTNYYNRTVEPCISVVADEMTRKFVRGRDPETGLPIHKDQQILLFRDPFKLVPVEKLPELADKLLRNEMATSNEMRAAIGWKPAKDPKADELRNANLNHPDEAQPVPLTDDSETKQMEGNQNGRV